MERDQWFILLYCGIIIIAAIITSRLLRYFIKKMLYKAEDKEKGHFDPTSYNFLMNATSAIIYIIAILAIFQIVPALRTFGSKLFAGAGVITIIIGIASQSALSNIVSGVFIVLFKPFRVSDIISVQNDTGTVEDITLRHVVIKTFQNRRIIIPNAIISSETILNHSIKDSRICNHFAVDISYDSDIKKAIDIVETEATAHPLTIDARKEVDIQNREPIVLVRATQWKENGVTVRANIWSSDVPEGFQLQCDLYQSIKNRFKEENIQHAYPQRIVKMKENETFSQA